MKACLIAAVLSLAVNAAFILALTWEVQWHVVNAVTVEP